MSDPGLLSTTAVAALERTINTALRGDPVTAAALSQHAGRLLAVHSTLPRTSVFLLIVDDGVELYLRSEAAADVSVTGNPVDLAALLLDWKRQPSAIGGPVRIEGNRELLQSLRELARDLQLDWGAMLEPALGGELAQTLHQGAMRLGGWAREAFRRIGDQVGDYLGNESGLLALRREVYEFYQDVDELRGDVDRLEARVQRLKARSRPVR
ncbi:ubiquinone biosynthesis accessory factor UbiJ [Alloalcanivorax xenomutans]|uniref:ubiquinone biosynthesis accessory factor UbiJ n=1 Tax=Alloalcanivorax xenomutans TaxID=1094342 RepID=UPI001F1A3D03|nr:SCP2 sterol-binding domain-containing protein [Alloalcanivorax xenomutans]MCE7523229.1 SCP2 sterol-binding domain-containing protein [Alloalcanivorax xenomutans]